jgi:hypothetical protein
VRGSIAAVTMRRDSSNNLIWYAVPKLLRENAPAHIKAIINSRKYLGIPWDAQLNNDDGKEKIIKNLKQRIGLVVAKADSIREAVITHNILVCQVATFSMLCINMSLRECASIENSCLKLMNIASTL